MVLSIYHVVIGIELKWSDEIAKLAHWPVTLAFETWSLTEQSSSFQVGVLAREHPGIRQSLTYKDRVTGTHSYACLVYGCWEFMLRSSLLHNKNSHQLSHHPGL